MKGGTSSKAELLSVLRTTRENNKSLNDCLSTLEDEIKEMKKISEFFAAQQLYAPPTTSLVSTE